VHLSPGPLCSLRLIPLYTPSQPWHFFNFFNFTSPILTILCISITWNNNKNIFKLQVVMQQNWKKGDEYFCKALYMRVLLSEYEDQPQCMFCGSRPVFSVLSVFRSGWPLQEVIRDALCGDFSSVWTQSGTESAYSRQCHQHAAHKSPENMCFEGERHLFSLMLEEISS
jgi:hypothetical protein